MYRYPTEERANEMTHELLSSLFEDRVLSPADWANVVIYAVNEGGLTIDQDELNNRLTHDPRVELDENGEYFLDTYRGMDD